MNFHCLVAFDRWACTSQSAHIRQFSSVPVARRLFPLPFFVWSLVNIPFLFYCNLAPPTYNCSFTSNLFEQIANYFIVPILAVLFPLCILITFVLLTYRNIRRSTHIRQQLTQNRLSTWEQHMTRIMLTQTLFTIICSMSRAIYVIYTAATLERNATKNFNQISIELLINQLTAIIMCINSSSSFFIFLLISPRFRKTIKISIKRLFHIEHNQINITNIPIRAQRIMMQRTGRQYVNTAMAAVHT